MAYFLKGNTTSFIFDKTDNVKLLNLSLRRNVKLEKGGEKFPFDNLNSRAIQLQLSRQTLNRIDTGRIAITIEWEDDKGIIQQATFEKDVYKILQGFIRKLSAGKISGLFIGEEAFRLWENNQVELCQMILGRFTYQKDQSRHDGSRHTIGCRCPLNGLHSRLKQDFILNSLQNHHII